MSLMLLCQIHSYIRNVPLPYAPTAEDVSPESIGLLSVLMILFSLALLVFPEFPKALWIVMMNNLFKRPWEDVDPKAKPFREQSNNMDLVVRCIGLLILIFGLYLFFDADGFYEYWYK
jgi:hypothetical protein